MLEFMVQWNRNRTVPTILAWEQVVLRYECREAHRAPLLDSSPSLSPLGTATSAPQALLELLDHVSGVSALNWVRRVQGGAALFFRRVPVHQRSVEYRLPVR